MIAKIDGYVADTLYSTKFHPHIQPPWIDAALALRGIIPPRTGLAPFRHVDLGCGDAIGLILAAASHPQGQFIGVDVMPGHIARGQRMVDALGLTNVTLHCAGFEACGALADASADYVVSHGVLAWISEPNRQCLTRLAADWLRPGGVLSISYNALPGWTPLLPFQAMVRVVAQALEGNSSERFAAACTRLRETDLIAERVWTWIDEVRSGVGATYFAHEYLNDHWRPCWSGDVVTALSDLGLVYAGQGSGPRMRPDLSLKARWRETIASLPGVAAGETAADILADCWFRRDLYLKLPGAGFENFDSALDWRSATWWGLSAGITETMWMTAETAAGDLDFENAASRAIRERLTRGTATLAQIAADTGLSPADLVNTCDAMWIAGMVEPLDPPQISDIAQAANAYLQASGISINATAGPQGGRQV